MDTLENRLIEALKEVRDDVRGKKLLNERSIEVEDIDVSKIRRKYKLSQRKFSEMFGVSIRTLQKWEQREVRPDGAARTLLKVVDYAPETVNKALKNWNHETRAH